MKMKYEVINGRDLKGTVKFQDSIEADILNYKELLEKSQKFFEAVKRDSKLLEDKRYFIIAPKKYEDVGLANHIDIYDEDKNHVINANFLYVNPDHAVRVKKKEDGYYYSWNDGRHRFLAAQKFQMDLLVMIVD